MIKSQTFITDLKKYLRIWESIYDLLSEKNKLCENNVPHIQKKDWSSECEIVWDFNCHIYTLLYFPNFLQCTVIAFTTSKRII